MFRKLKQRHNVTYCSVSSTKERNIDKVKSCMPDAEAREKIVIEVGILSVKLLGSQERQLVEL